MRNVLLMLCLLAAAAWADAPVPTGLALIQARYAGTWHVEEADYDTEVSRTGTRQYDLTRDCTLKDAVLDCRLMAQGSLQGEQRISWDAAAGSYHVEMDIAGHPQPPLTLTVKGDAWNFLEEVKDRDGQPLTLRIQRQYHSDTEVSTSAGYSRDGVHWTPMSRGTEIRKSGPT